MDTKTCTVYGRSVSTPTAMFPMKFRASSKRCRSVSTPIKWSRWLPVLHRRRIDDKTPQHAWWANEERNASKNYRFLTGILDFIVRTVVLLPIWCTGLLLFEIFFSSCSKCSPCLLYSARIFQNRLFYNWLWGLIQNRAHSIGACRIPSIYCTSLALHILLTIHIHTCSL